MSEITRITESAEDLPTIGIQDYSSQGLLSDFAKVRVMNEMAQMMSTAAVAVPQHLRGKQGDCLAIVMQAAQWGMNPFAVAQKTHLVNGSLGYEAQLVIAVLNSSPLLHERIKFEWFGDWKGVAGKTDKSHERGVRVFATIKGEAEPREMFVTMAQAGVRNSPLWEIDPKQQLAYLAAKRWARLHTPDVILGVYTPDELEQPAEKDMGAAEDVTQKAQPKSRADKARAALADKRGESQTIPAVTLPTLNQVLSAIDAAHDGETMAKAKELGAQMADGPDKQTAIDAYKRRAAALKANAEQPPTVDPETGEVQDDFLTDYEAAEQQ